MKPVCVDAMGGDAAPDVIVQAALRAHDSGIPIVLCGPESVLQPLLGGVELPILHSDHALGSGGSAWDEIRERPRSSVRVGLEAVRDGRASAFISCGSSGGVLLESVRTLGILDGLARPALAVSIPRGKFEPLILLDAGANVDCRADLLVSFAHLGVAWARALGHRGVQPGVRVGLLSNGAEPSKGNDAIREAIGRLASSGLHVVGQVEPHRAVAGDCDVLVADGLVGNVMLKSMEAAVEIVRAHLAEADEAGAPSQETLQVLSWERHGAAILLGVDGLVLIGHGRSEQAAALHAIRAAHRAAQSDARERLTAALRDR